MPGGGARGTAAAVTIGTSAAQIVGANSSRESVIIQNNHASNNLYIGFTSGVTTAAGTKVPPGASWSDQMYQGPVFGIADAASTDVRYQEIY